VSLPVHKHYSTNVILSSLAFCLCLQEITLDKLDLHRATTGQGSALFRALGTLPHLISLEMEVIKDLLDGSIISDDPSFEGDEFLGSITLMTQVRWAWSGFIDRHQKEIFISV
jgi:hypothetical protein